MFAAVKRVIRPLFLRAPWIRAKAFDAIDLAVSPFLFFFKLDRSVTDTARAAAIEAKTGDLNDAAERYYIERTDIQHLLGKPFSEPGALPRRLIDLGILFDGLRLEPGDTVLELGAGTCWVSHLLNRSGCRTIAVDVSASALRLGRQVFEQDPQTNWQLDPQFLSYDGYRLPVADATIDRIILYDAYHHLPNAAHLLREMRRVLKADGIVGMSEPGRGHADSRPTVAEAEATGVLENELAIEDIGEAARASGFAAARVVVAIGPPFREIETSDLRSFIGGRGFARYWQSLAAGLDGHHYILLFAGDPVCDTRRPKLLRARIGGPASIGLRAGAKGRIELTVHNDGDTRWLSTANAPGWTRLGIHLYRAGDAGAPPVAVDFDWLRVGLPCDVSPDATVRTTAELPPIPAPGAYVLGIDLVIEGVAWFADRSSSALEVPCTVHA